MLLLHWLLLIKGWVVDQSGACDQWISWPISISQPHTDYSSITHSLLYIHTHSHLVTEAAHWNTHINSALFSSSSSLSSSVVRHPSCTAKNRSGKKTKKIYFTSVLCLFIENVFYCWAVVMFYLNLWNFWPLKTKQSLLWPLVIAYFCCDQCFLYLNHIQRPEKIQLFGNSQEMKSNIRWKFEK